MPLAVSAQEKSSAVERLHRWLERLITLKRQKVLDEPELFAMVSCMRSRFEKSVSGAALKKLAQIALSGARGGSRFLYEYDEALVP